MAQLGRDTEATRFDTGRVAFLLSSAFPGIGIRAVGFDDLPQINQRNLHKSGQHKLGIRSQVANAQSCLNDLITSWSMKLRGQF